MSSQSPSEIKTLFKTTLRRKGLDHHIWDTFCDIVGKHPLLKHLEGEFIGIQLRLIKHERSLRRQDYDSSKLSSEWNKISHDALDLIERIDLQLSE